MSMNTDNIKKNIDTLAERALRRHWSLTILWVTGVVLAQGFWSTFWAFLLPFWGWYVAVRFFLHYFGVLS